MHKRISYVEIFFSFISEIKKKKKREKEVKEEFVLTLVKGWRFRRRKIVPWCE